MPDEFGQPGAGDPTSRYERIMEKASKRAADFVERRGPNILNRAIGSEAIPREEQLKDFIALSQNPEMVAQRHQALAAVLGERRATQEFVEWAQKMMAYMETER